MLKHGFRGVLLALVVLANTAAHASAQSTIFVTRHTDRGPEEPDAALTSLGLHQAADLGRMLADTGIKHIFTTDLVRTQQTAAPTAARAGIAPVVVDQKDFDGLIAKIRATLRDGEATLVVGHRATVPRIVKALSGREIPPLASDEFTRLVAITLFPDGRVSVVTLRYGTTPNSTVKRPS